MVVSERELARTANHACFIFNGEESKWNFERVDGSLLLFLSGEVDAHHVNKQFLNDNDKRLKLSRI